MVRMVDIANEAGVSVSLVSRTLRGISTGNTSSQKRILQIARRLGYRAVEGDKTNHLSRTSQIAFLSSAVSADVLFNPIAFSHLFEGMRNTTEKRGYSLVVSSVAKGEVPPCIAQRTVDGVLFHGFVTKDFYDKYLASIPLVSLQYYNPQLPCSCVLVDNFNAMYQVVEYLVKSGHRKIGFVADEIERMHSSQRYEGFLKAMKTFGLEIRQEWLVTWERPMINGFLPAQVTVPDYTPKLSHIFTGGNDRPSAIVCPGDFQAIAVITAVRKFGLQVPKDISVTGMGHNTLAEMFEPAITSIDDRQEEVAALGAKYLLNRVEGQSEEIVTVAVRPKLVVRETTCVI